jgi:hypothetical protein
MQIIIETPNFGFAMDMKSSAPAGISILAGRRTAGSADDPAVAILLLKKGQAMTISREDLVSWILSKVAKDERCVIDYNGQKVEKQATAIRQMIDAESGCAT